jgi:hypothetical protein
MICLRYDIIILPYSLRFVKIFENYIDNIKLKLKKDLKYSRLYVIIYISMEAN